MVLNANHPIEGVRLEDVDSFLKVFIRSKELPYTKRTTYAGLFGSNEDDRTKYTTVITQLQRIARFGVKLLPTRPPGLDGEVEDLFARLTEGDGGLQATPLANALFKELTILQEVYRHVGIRAATRLGTNQQRRVVRIGAGPNFAMHILPYALSAREDVGIPPFEFEMTNTADLLPRLNSGLLDFVIAYGSVNQIGVRQEGFPGLRIGFTSFRFQSNLILAAHPLAKVVHGQNDVNESYQDHLRVLRSRKKKDAEESSPRYSELRPVNLEHIDFARSGLDLVVTRSWDNPPGLTAYLGARPVEKHVRWVESYDEAVTLVKLRLGLAVLPQVFSKRRMVHAFRLAPQKDFIRWIGAYYSPRFPLSAEAYRLLNFIRAYLLKFELQLRNGKPPAFPDPAYIRWCAEQNRPDETWTAKAEEEYPLRLTKK